MTPDPQARIAQLEAENAALQAQVSELPVLREQVTVLLARVRELEAQRALLSSARRHLRSHRSMYLSVSACEGTTITGYPMRVKSISYERLTNKGPANLLTASCA